MKQVFFALMCIGFLSSCDSLKTLKLYKKGAVQKGSFTNKMTFDTLRNLILVKVFIKEKPYNFILDTGAPLCAISEKLAQELGLKPQSKLSVGDAQGNSKKGNLYAIESINIGNTIFTNEIFVGADFSKMSVVGENIDGIIGTTVMKKAAWFIDNEHKTITIASDVNALPKLENAFRLPFKCKSFDFSPSVKIQLDGIAYDLGFDTGSNNGVNLDKKSVVSAQKNMPLTYTTFSVGNPRMGLYGRGNIDTTYFMKIQKTQLGDAVIGNEQIVSFRKKASSIIGMQILKNYNLLLDWQRKEILLSPIREVPKDVLKPWGFSCVFEENSLKITEIFDNSDAAKKGLMLNDVVLKINEKSYQSLSKKEQYAIVLGDLIPTEITEAHLIVLRNKEEIKIDLKK
jgi:Aspartyl protease